MLWHRIVVVGNLRDQLNRSIWPQTAAKKEQMIHSIQKRELFADGTASSVCRFVLRFQEYSVSNQRISPCSLSKKHSFGVFKSRYRASSLPAKEC